MKVLALLAIILIAAPAFAQNVFHPASEVAAGIFGSSVGGGNYTFNNSMFVVDKLGVGTTSPGELLQVGAGNNKLAYFFLNNGGSIPSSTFGLKIGYNYLGGPSEADFWNAYESATTSFMFKQKTGASTFTDLLTILANGNVGIGTSPGAKLDVSGFIQAPNEAAVAGYAAGGYSGRNSAGTSKIILTVGSTWAAEATRLRSAGGGISIENSSASALVAITESGKVGIGTTNPSSILEVTGVITGAGIISTGIPALKIQSTVPTIYYNDTDAAVNNRWWQQPIANGLWYIQGLNDAGGGGGSIFGLTRSAENIDAMFVGLQATPTLIANASSGKVGIGTASPGTTLDVVGSARLTSFASAAGGPAGLELGYDTINDRALVQAYNRGAVAYKNLMLNGMNLTFSTQGNEQMRLTTAGYVGIGTTTPKANLQIGDAATIFSTTSGVNSQTRIGRNVYTDSTPTFRRLVADNEAPMIQLSNDGEFQVYMEQDAGNTVDSVIDYSAPPAFRVANNGNVGIGVAVGTAPSQKLHVAGNVNVTGNVYVNGVCFTPTTFYYCATSGWRSTWTSLPSGCSELGRIKLLAEC